MDPNLIPNILAASFILVPVFISFRAFSIYARTRAPRIWILGLALAYIAFTALDNLAVNLLHIPFNTYWFLYLGQTISFFFIWLSLLMKSETSLWKLMDWHIVISVLFLELLLFSPLIPAFPNVTVRAIVNGSRFVPCLGVGICYIFAFLIKSTRFSFWMGLAFLLMGYGIVITVGKYFNPNPDLLDMMGDITRLVGLVTLLIATFVK